MFTCIRVLHGPSLWNKRLHAVRSNILSGSLSASSSKSVFSLVAKLTGSASERCMLREALYKWTNTKQCNKDRWLKLQAENLCLSIIPPKQDMCMYVRTYIHV